MKICLITSTYKLSSTDTNVPFLVENVRHLRQRGVDVHVFAPSYEGQGSQVIDGVPVYRFRYFFRPWENLTHFRGAPNRIRNPFYLFVALFYIVLGLIHAVYYCRRHKFDLIHVHWPFPHGIWGVAASRLSGAPLVLTFHGSELLLMKKYFFVKYFLRHAIKNASAVTSNSSYTQAKIHRIASVPVQLVAYGCTVTPRHVQKNADKPVKDILFVGRLIPRKGVQYLIHAMPLLNRDVPAHLHIVGDGNMGAEWRKLTSDLGLSDMVTFHGAIGVEALEQHYADADVFVLPAIVDERGDTEGLGVVLVEALSFRTPVVASDVGGIGDVIKSGCTGLLVPEKDPAALAGAIRRLLDDPELRQCLADGGLAHVQSLFDWERITDQMLEIYRACTSTKVELKTDKADTSNPQPCVALVKEQAVSAGVS